MVSDRGTFSAAHVARLHRHDCNVLCSVPWHDYRALFDQHRAALFWLPASYLSLEQIAAATRTPRCRRNTTNSPSSATSLPIPKLANSSPVACCSSSARPIRRSVARRAKTIAALQAGLEKIAASVQRGHVRSTPQAIARRVTKLFGNKSARHYFRWELVPLTAAEQRVLPSPSRGCRRPTHRFVFHFDAAAAEAAAAHDGYLEGVKDKQAGIDKVKQGLEKYLQDISYDDLTKTAGGALVLTGTGKGKKSGVGVVFAVGVLDVGGGQLAGAAFVVDQDVEQYFKETVRSICQTIRPAQYSESSYGGFSASTTAATVHITVRVAPDAQIWFDDTATKQTGTLREFESPPLTPGKTYTYDIRAQWRENGREVTQSRHIGVQAGGRVTVDFTSPSAQDNAAPPTVSPPPPPGPSGR